MKILVDIIHPANVHYFKYFIKRVKQDGHKVFIIAREKDVVFKLLQAYNLSFFSMGKGRIGKGGLGKLLYLVYAELLMFKYFLKLRPDIAISFGSTPVAHVSYMFRIPHISFDDTEHAKLNRKLYKPFTEFIATPSCFYQDLGKKHFRFNGYMELFYLHNYRFKPNINVLNELGIKENEPYVIVRYVSWGAFHDIGQKGLSLENRSRLINIISKYAKVFISSEGNIPYEIKKYEIKIAPEKIHDVLAFAKLYIGEGGTMASECALLGVPSIYINSLPLMGYLKDAKKAGLLYHVNNYDEIEETVVKILSDGNTKNRFKKLQKQFLQGKIDPTSLLIWLVESYPESKKILFGNPNYQYNFL